MAADDFSSAPWLYPGTPVDRSDPVEVAELDPDRGRTLVLAVGSNASRAVLQRKFDRFGVTPQVRFIRARVNGLRVGHSAHVSMPGYVPAAPVADPSASSDLVASLLDADGLAAVDATEPNYHRCTFDTDRFPLELDLEDGPARPAAFEVYVSRQGVLAVPGEKPLGLLAQEEIFAMLAERCPGFAGLAAGRPRDVMRAFADSAELRAAARKVFDDAGWVSQSMT